jgi:hypothetical protein
MQIYLPDDIYQELKLTAKLTNRPMSELVRMGLKKVLPSKVAADPLKHFVGKGKTKKAGNAMKELGEYYAKEA